MTDFSLNIEAGIQYVYIYKIDVPINPTLRLFKVVKFILGHLLQ